MFTRQMKVQIGKSTLIMLSIKGKMPTLAGNKHPFVQFSLMDRVFSICRQKSYASNTSEIDIKVVIPTPTQ